MNKMKDPLAEILERHGVVDADAFLQEIGEEARISTSPDPDVVVRGSVQLMKKRMVSRDEVQRGLAGLRFL
ncbi:hypothetical protein [Leisingera sp. M523]|uniref:hypothetical protein n=1 Tax=Leisingera sp. M523 TaxID=2867013 RepID=UPI0021A68355|nr:hypothetical protein [Leisingera sp. M523]UWQ27704.1 hypothetical protein K3557_12945 [Leisingera sp. M523]